MSTPAPIAPPSPPGLGRAAARSGAPPGELSFATLLQNDRARTAVAEGPHNEAQRETRAEHRSERSDVRLEHGAQPPAKVGRQPETPAQPEAKAEPQAPAVDPALRSPVPATPAEPVLTAVVASTTPVAEAIVEARAASANAAVPAEATTATPAVPAVPTQGATDAHAPAQPAVPSRPAVPATGAATTEASADQTTTQTAQPIDAASQTDDAAPATPAEGDAPAQEAEQLPGRSGEAPGRQGEHRPDGKPTGQQQGQGPVNANASDPNANANARAFETPSRSGVTPSRVAEAAPAPVAEPAAAASAPASPLTPQAEAAPATSAPPAVRGATTLQHLARTVDAAMQMGHARGITRAKLHLHPAELGAIELHLRHTANGMTARVVAESPEAVAVLQQASSDLRRSLEQAGITLTGLDIGARADQHAEQRTFAGAFDASNRDRTGSNGRGYGLTGGDETDTDPALQPIRARVPLPGGALVDVIA